VVVRYKIAEETQTAKATGGAVSYHNNKELHVFYNSGSITFPTSFNETVEYVMIGGGGAGGGIVTPNGAHGGAGGGAGGVRTGSTPIDNTSGGSPLVCPIVVGAGGAGRSWNLIVPISPLISTGEGLDSGKGGTTKITFPTVVTVKGGGYGAYGQPAENIPGGDSADPNGGSSGGNTRAITTAASSGTYGNPGGRQNPTVNDQGAGGGGGAGGPGGDYGGPPPSPTGYGGLGVQLPTTFHNPDLNPGPSPNPQGGGGLGYPGPGSPGLFWVAGGGGGGAGTVPITGAAGGPGGAGTMSAGPYAGAGNGGSNPNGAGVPGGANSGSGGGGGGSPAGDTNRGSNGGSGLVLIAFPNPT
jgi:hypothetical protein